MVQQSGDSMENAMTQINNGYYSRIIYDKWRDVFYRVGVYFDVKNEITSPSEVAMAFRKKKILILTFDKDLNILSKNEFDAINNRLNEYYTWITEKGLFMYQSQEITKRIIINLLGLIYKNLSHDHGFHISHYSHCLIGVVVCNQKEFK